MKITPFLEKTTLFKLLEEVQYISIDENSNLEILIQIQIKVFSL